MLFVFLEDGDERELKCNETRRTQKFQFKDLSSSNKSKIAKTWWLLLHYSGVVYKKLSVILINGAYFLNFKTVLLNFWYWKGNTI